MRAIPNPASAAGAAIEAVASRYQSLFAEPAPRRLLLAATGSYIGDRLSTIALVALSFDLGGSAESVGVMLAMIMLPRLVLQGPAGAIVDRQGGRRWLLPGTQLAMAAIASGFVLLTWFPSLWLLYLLAFLLAAGRTIDMPAFEVRLMTSVPPAQRGAANAAHMLAITIGDLIGPLLGGVLLTVLAAPALFILNGLSFVLLARATWRTPMPFAVDEAGAAVTETGTGGYRWLIRQRDVALYALLTLTASALLLGTIALFASRANDLGMGERGVAFFYAAMGIGTLIGGTLAGGGVYSARRSLAIAGGAAIASCMAQLAYGVTTIPIVALTALLIFGLLGDVEEIAALTFFQLRLPAGSFGRFFSLFLMANGAGGIVGALLIPRMASVLGSGQALALAALPAIAAAFALALQSLITRESESPGAGEVCRSAHPGCIDPDSQQSPAPVA